MRPSPAHVRALMFAGLVAMLAASAPVAHAGVAFTPHVHRDARDRAAGLLDLRAVSFAQEGIHLILRIQMQTGWRATTLRDRGPRRICLTVIPHRRPHRGRRICVVGRGGRAALLFSSLRAGAPTHLLQARVTRDGARIVAARFTALAARLPRGGYSWRVRTAWTGRRACRPPAGCHDSMPDRGVLGGRIRVFAEPRCFGAASRDRHHRCVNRRLARIVVPSPSVALRTPNAYCAPGPRVGTLLPCIFGVPRDEAVSTIALVGDSHAEHWRAALAVVAQQRRWRGISLIRSSCPFTTGRPRLRPDALAACVLHNAQLRQWFRHHPEVHAVFVSANARDGFHGSPEAGYRGALRSFPPSVHTIFVLRDSPSISAPQTPCLLRVIAAHRSTRRCAQSRRSDLHRDREVIAARSLHSRRIRVLDFSDLMCSRSLCFPVVGGALVHKDGAHLTRVFAATLGPFVLRAVDHAIPHSMSAR